MTTQTTLLENIKGSFSRFKLTMFCLIALFIVLFPFLDIHGRNARVPFAYFFGCATLITLGAKILYEHINLSKIAYALIIILPLCVVGYAAFSPDSSSYIRLVPLVLSVLFLVLCPFIFERNKDNSSFGALTYYMVGLVTFVIVMPLYVFPHIPYTKTIENSFDECSKAVTFIVKWILVPASLVYIFILYAYYIKTYLFNYTPITSLFWLSNSLILLGIITYYIAYPLKDSGSRLTQFFMRYFLYIVAVPLGFALYSIGIRIVSYGFTEMRYLGMLLNLWFGITILLFIFRKYNSHLINAVVALFIITASTMLPWSSPYTLAYKSQASELKELLTDMQLLDDSGKMIAYNYDDNEDRFKDKRKIDRLKNIITYLTKSNWKKKNAQRYAAITPFLDDKFQTHTSAITLFKHYGLISNKYPVSNRKLPQSPMVIKRQKRESPTAKKEGDFQNVVKAETNKNSAHYDIADYGLYYPNININFPNLEKDNKASCSGCKPDGPFHFRSAALSLVLQNNKTASLYIIDLHDVVKELSVNRSDQNSQTFYPKIYIEGQTNGKKYRLHLTRLRVDKNSGGYLEIRRLGGSLMIEYQ